MNITLVTKEKTSLSAEVQDMPQMPTFVRTEDGRIFRCRVGRGSALGNIYDEVRLYVATILPLKEPVLCRSCGHQLPEGEELNRFHYASGPCPKGEP